MHVRHQFLSSPAHFCSLGLILSVICSGCGGEEPPPPAEPTQSAIILTSPAFADGQMIPKEFTCEGADRSPPLAWSGVPSAARSLVLVCDDPNGIMRIWSHWVIFNLPPQTKSLEEGIPRTETFKVDAGEGHQGINDFHKIGYGGPCPPSGTHSYSFRLYALDIELNLTAKATRSDVLVWTKGHTLGEGRLTGKYQRGGKK